MMAALADNGIEASFSFVRSVRLLFIFATTHFVVCALVFSLVFTIAGTQSLGLQGFTTAVCAAKVFRLNYVL